MKDKKPEGKDREQDGMNPMVAVVAGAVVGAGIAVAGVALSDKKNREKVRDVVTKAKHDVEAYVGNVQKRAEASKKAMNKRIASDDEKIRKVVNSAKDSLHKTTEQVNSVIKSL